MQNTSNSKPVKQKKRLSERELRRIETTKKRHGDDFWHRNAVKAGKKTPTKFDSERGREAARKRWAAHREKKGLTNGQSKQG